MKNSEWEKVREYVVGKWGDMDPRCYVVEWIKEGYSFDTIVRLMGRSCVDKGFYNTQGLHLSAEDRAPWDKADDLLMCRYAQEKGKAWDFYTHKAKYHFVQVIEESKSLDDNVANFTYVTPVPIDVVKECWLAGDGRRTEGSWNKFRTDGCALGDWCRDLHSVFYYGYKRNIYEAVNDFTRWAAEEVMGDKFDEVDWFINQHLPERRGCSIHGFYNPYYIYTRTYWTTENKLHLKYGPVGSSYYAAETEEDVGKYVYPELVKFIESNQRFCEIWDNGLLNMSANEVIEAHKFMKNFSEEHEKWRCAYEY